MRTPSALVVVVAGFLAFLGVLIQSIFNLNIAKLPIEYTQTAEYRLTSIAEATQQVPTVTETPTLTPTATPNLFPVLFVVSADKDWQDSELYIGEFEYVKFMAEGQWSPGGDPLESLVSANGVMNSPLVSPVNVISGCYHGALIARIGETSQPFCVGSSMLLQVGESGYIFLRINDNRIEDNFGYLHLTICSFAKII